MNARTFVESSLKFKTGYPQFMSFVPKTVAFTQIDFSSDFLLQPTKVKRKLMANINLMKIIDLPPLTTQIIAALH